MTIPLVDLDLFSPTSLADPFEDYRLLRDAGPVVRLARPDVYAIGRFADVQAALRASDSLISGEGVGFSAAFNAPKGMNVIQSDGDLHRRLRAAVMRPLTPSKLRVARTDFKDLIRQRVEGLADRGEFDAMAKLANFLPIEAVSHLVGLPEVGRDRMLGWAAAAFNAIGPDFAAADAASMRDAFAFLGSLTEDTVAAGSWAGQLFEAVHAGKLTSQEAMAAISAYVIPSLDTTILAKGHLLHNLATTSGQWAMLRADANLIPAAVLEGVRHSSVIRWFSRVAVTDYPVQGFVIPAGSRVMLLYGSANRDERRYAEPDRFDVTRDARDHLAWGTGPHLCAGMTLAAMEMEVLLEALIEADVDLVAGSPTRGANAGLFGFTELPFTLERR